MIALLLWAFALSLAIASAYVAGLALTCAVIFALCFLASVGIRHARQHPR